MTALTQLNIHALRNIRSATISNLHSRYNIFYGANGSGKTSLLEAIYLLSRGHSFRTREVAPLITHEASELTVFARLDVDHSISIQKFRSGSTRVKLNQQYCQRSSELAHVLPCQLIYQDLFQIMDAGPSIRRNLLDWGMFHVKHSYHAIWKQHQHVLQQRNALLRQSANRQHFKPWDALFIDLSEQLHALRLDYFKEWSTVFQTFLAQLTDVACTIHYEKGWDRKKSGKPLADILSEQFAQDCLRQYTQSGPHQADILFDSVVSKAKKTLSRGQQKMILIALKLSQAHFLSTPCLYLFDDVTAELDAAHIQRLIDCIETLDGQFFFTTMDVNQLRKFEPLKDASAFNLVDGVVKCSTTLSENVSNEPCEEYQ